MKILDSINLAKYTTYKIGGNAKHFTICESVDDIRVALEWCDNKKLHWFVIGNGSNILVSDDGFPGLVIKLGKSFSYFNVNDKTIEVGASTLLPTMSRHCLENGFGGFEFLCDIPGTVGGGVRMNAGTKQGTISENLIFTTALSPKGVNLNLSKFEMEFKVRHSKLSETRDIVISASFSVPRSIEKEIIKNNMKRIIASRRESQPANRRNCGSVFKNYPGQKPAGWYIEQSGLKGMKIGNAMVALEHANWIVNHEKAKSADIKQLIEKVQNEVFKKFGIQLVRELIYIPEDII